MKEDLFGNKVKERGTLDEHCRECGQEMRVYKQVFGSNLAAAITRFAGYHSDEVDMDLFPEDRSQTSILASFGLLEKVLGPDGAHKPRCWRVTRLGRDFVYGKEKIPKWIWTYNGEVYGGMDKAPTIGMGEAMHSPPNKGREYRIADEKVFSWYWEWLKNGPVKQSYIGELLNE